VVEPVGASVLAATYAEALDARRPPPPPPAADPDPVTDVAPNLKPEPKPVKPGAPKPPKEPKQPAGRKPRPWLPPLMEEPAADGTKVWNVTVLTQASGRSKPAITFAVHAQTLPVIQRSDCAQLHRRVRGETSRAETKEDAQRKP
jgi:hypothetical protein